MTITTSDGKSMPAKVIGIDSKTDLALLKAQGDDFPYVTFASQTPRVGDWVIAVGNPFGLGGTVTAGIVSARGRDIGSGPYDDFLQIDAPVNHGNSGGPTFNAEGEVVGVNTAIFSPSGGSVGIGFAIASDVVKNVVQQLKENGSVTRGWIGVQIQNVTPDLADDLGLKEHVRRAGGRGAEGFARRRGGREERRRHHRGRRRDGRRSARSRPPDRGARPEEDGQALDHPQRLADDDRRDARNDAGRQDGERGYAQFRRQRRVGAARQARADAALGARPGRRRRRGASIRTARRRTRASSRAT